MSWLFRANSNHVIAVGTLLAAGAAIWYAIIAGQTLEKIDQQLAAMRSTIYQNREVVRQSIAQSRSAKQSADTAVRALKTTEQTVELTRQSNALTRDALYATESADIQIDGITCMPEPLGPDTGVVVVWHNTGRTTASQMMSVIGIGIYGGTNQAPPSISVSTVGAGQVRNAEPVMVRNIQASLGQIPITTENLLQIINAENSRYVLHVWGWAKYTDKFNRKHMLVFDSGYVPRSACLFNIQKIVTR